MVTQPKKMAFADSDSDMGSISGDESGSDEFETDDASSEDEGLEDDDGALRWKSNLREKAAKTHRQKTTVSCYRFSKDDV